MIKSEKQKLLLIFCAVFTVGLLQLFLVFTISGDGPYYINVAKSFYAGDFKAGLAKEQHPLYSLLMALAYNLTHNWVAAGQSVSFIFGLLAVFPVYFLAKDIFGEKIGILTAVFFAFHPFLCKYSAIIRSEAVYIFLFACSVWLSWRAISRQKYSLYFLAGLTAGLNYLNRPEGLGISVVTGLYILFHNLPQFKNTYKKRLISICLLGIGTLIFVSPYMLYIRDQSGSWQLSKKKSIITAVFGCASRSIPPATLPSIAKIPSYSRMEEGYFRTLRGNVLTFVKVYYPTLFLLLLLSFVRRKAIPRRQEPELFIGLIPVFYILVFSLFYVSDRHLVPLVSVCLFWAAIGFYELYHLILAKVSLVKTNIMSALNNKVFAVLLIGVIITLLPYVLGPQDRDKIGQRKVGEWIKENCGENSFILTDLDRIPFYAGGYFVPLQNRPGIDNYNDLLKFAKTPHEDGYGYEPGHSHSVDYIIIDKSRIANYCPDFLSSVNPATLEEVHVQPKLSHSTYGEIVVYRVKYAN